MPPLLAEDIALRIVPAVLLAWSRTRGPGTPARSPATLVWFAVMVVQRIVSGGGGGCLFS